jgi:hypothetical protein
MTWLGRSSVLVSMPLATETTGTSLGAWGLRRSKTGRTYCEGMALRMSVAPSKHWESLAVRRTCAGTLTPGRSFRCSRS